MDFPEDVPTLTDGTVTLRAHRAEDAQGSYEQCQDPLSQRWTTVPLPYSIDDARSFVGEMMPAGWRSDTEWAFAIEALDDTGTPRYAGTMSLRNEGDRRAEIAYGSHPWVRGRGVIERAARLMLDWGFSELGLQTVIWWANTGNWASRRLAWRLGFSVDGTVRRWLPQRGELIDGWVGALLADDERAPRTLWYDAPVVVGDAVALRPHRDDDAARVMEACNDEQAQYWFHRLPSPYTLEDARAYLEGRIEQRASGAGISWAVTCPGSDDLVANISLFDVKPGREAEIGYWTHPAARGRGVATEACRLVLRHAFVPEEDGGLGLQRVRIYAAESNTASRRVIEKAGFTEVGRERRSLPVRGGELVDVACYDMLAEEFSLT
ncbi:MAG: GNAT family N-acetyltransferase [Nocardioidaceae bacterium]